LFGALTWHAPVSLKEVLVSPRARCLVLPFQNSPLMQVSISAGGTILGTDLNKIKAGGDGIGLRMYDPGYVNTTAVISRICFIDGAKGVLRYRGYPIEQVQTLPWRSFTATFSVLPTKSTCHVPSVAREGSTVTLMCQQALAFTLCLLWHAVGRCVGLGRVWRSGTRFANLWSLIHCSWWTHTHDINSSHVSFATTCWFMKLSC
jgi:hypothetical protein